MSGKFKETCRHFAMGRCEWGAGCKFTHRTEPMDKSTGDWYHHKKKTEPKRERESETGQGSYEDETLTLQGVPCGGGWLRFYDEASGYHWYQNPETGESKWDTVPVKKQKTGNEGVGRGAAEVITIGNAPKQESALCKFYAQGRCTRGAACQFYHPPPTVPDVQAAVQTALQVAAAQVYHDGYDWDAYARHYGLSSGWDAYCQYYYRSAAPPATAAQTVAPSATQQQQQDPSALGTAQQHTVAFPAGGSAPYNPASSAQNAPLPEASAPRTGQHTAAVSSAYEPQDPYDGKPPSPDGPAPGTQEENLTRSTARGAALHPRGEPADKWKPPSPDELPPGAET